MFFFFDLSEGMENCKKSGKNQGKVGEFRGGLQVTTLVIHVLMIEILGYLCLFYCINILINLQVLTFTKKNLVCYLSKIEACGLVTGCRLGMVGWDEE